ncbi:MAG: hypothetical protein IPN84_10380 [Sphingomonadales bacterium]|jgi:hypothetical protein|nr:hypothetical protein [Sphingomonadales bacterium]
MTEKKQDQTDKGSVELTEEALDQASGGASYIKFDGIDGESIIKAPTTAIKQTNVFKF